MNLYSGLYEWCDGKAGLRHLPVVPERRWASSVLVASIGGD